MTTSKVRIPSGTAHISIDERGRGWIDSTDLRVDQVVADVIGPDKMTPQGIVEAYPFSNLTLASIHAALAWYYDHQAEMDAEFERELAMVAEAREGQQNSKLAQKALAFRAAREAAAKQSS